MMIRKYIVTLVAALVLSGCATTYNPATEHNELIFITTPAEVSIGKTTAVRVSREYKISKDPEKINRVKKIGEKIAAVSDRKDLRYHFFVIEDKNLNAFTLPGGYIYVNSGVLDKSTDDELVCVIGHEVGHVAARHIAKKLQAQIGYDILINIAASRSGIADLQRAVSITFNLVMLGYSRDDELSADRLGAKYAYMAGYDPYAMISFFKKLQGADEKNMGPVFLRSHPYASQRIKMLEMQLPAIIEKARKKQGIAVIPDNQPLQSNITSVAPASKEGERPLKVMCPVCRRIYPGTTNFCPYDGTKLQ